MNLTLQNKGSFLTRFLLIGVFLVTLSMPTWAQEKITVSGKILDNTNEPLPGAAVLVQGSKDGTQSDINGEYVITVNSNAVLEFSFIGFKSQSVSVNGRAKINVTLEPDATMLQEVVAIGYGSQRKEDLSMAVSSASHASPPEALRRLCSYSTCAWNCRAGSFSRRRRRCRNRAVFWPGMTVCRKRSSPRRAGEAGSP